MLPLHFCKDPFSDLILPRRFDLMLVRPDCLRMIDGSPVAIYCSFHDHLSDPIEGILYARSIVLLIGSEQENHGYRI